MMCPSKLLRVFAASLVLAAVGCGQRSSDAELAKARAEAAEAKAELEKIRASQSSLPKSPPGGKTQPAPLTTTELELRDMGVAWARSQNYSTAGLSDDQLIAFGRQAKQEANRLVLKPDYVVTAQNLLAEYNADLRRANEKYRGRRLQISGLIDKGAMETPYSEVTKRTSTYVSLSTGGVQSKRSITLYFDDDEFHLGDKQKRKDARDAIRRMSPGQAVSVIGTCGNMEPAFFGKIEDQPIIAIFGCWFAEEKK